MGARGERVLTLPGGDEVAILFTNFALAEAEQRTGKSVLALMSGGQFGISDTAQLLRAGMQAANRENGRGTGPRPHPRSP